METHCSTPYLLCIYYLGWWTIFPSMQHFSSKSNYLAPKVKGQVVQKTLLFEGKCTCRLNGKLLGLISSGIQGVPLTPIFDTPDYILRPNNTKKKKKKKKFKKCFAWLQSAYYLHSQLPYFDQKCLKKFKPCSTWHHLTSIHDHRYALEIHIPFYNNINCCKSVKRFLLLDFHSENLERHKKVNIVHK